MRQEQIEKVFANLQTEIASIKKHNLELEKRIEVIEGDPSSTQIPPKIANDKDSQESPLFKVVKLLNVEIMKVLPGLVEKKVQAVISGFITHESFEKFKKSLNDKYIVTEKFVEFDASIKKRLNDLEINSGKHISFITIHRITNEYYKDEAEKLLFKKYGWWLKYKKDIIWCFVFYLVITMIILIMGVMLKNGL